jgi:hypothetical protein
MGSNGAPKLSLALAASPGCGGWEKENFDLDGRAVIMPMTIGYFKRTMRSIEEIEVARRRRSSSIYVISRHNTSLLKLMVCPRINTMINS